MHVVGGEPVRRRKDRWPALRRVRIVGTRGNKVRALSHAGLGHPNRAHVRSRSAKRILAAKLKVLGECIRAHREQQKVNATVLAEAAGMSCVTLHRIERGEPSVTMAACHKPYLTQACSPTATAPSAPISGSWTPDAAMKPHRGF
jgi:DNA-binding transcriptional regulator YiaG